MGCAEECAQICARYGVTIEEARSRCRTTHIAAARHALWQFLASKGWSANGIAAEFGVHHTTVCEALKKKSPQLTGGDG